MPPPWTPDPATENMPKSSGAYIMSNTVAVGLFGPQYDVLRDFNLKDQKTLDAWQKESRRVGFGRSPDLIPMSKTGGKIVLWVGDSDPCCSSDGMQDYVDYVTKLWDGDKARVAKFMTLYQIPGQGHCSGGTGPIDAPDRLLETLIAWVEEGKQPGGVVMHRGADRAQFVFGGGDGKPVAVGINVPKPEGGSRDFLVCPYPQKSVFDKSKADVPGAVFEAANWSCVAR